MLTADEQELVDVATAALPGWFVTTERQLEDLGMMARVMGSASMIGNYWFSQTLITQASGAIGSNPDWLNQHAKDRGTARQAGEGDIALRQRIRNTPDALTRPALLAAAQAIVDASLVAGAVAMVELRRDRAFTGSYGHDSGTGGVFALVGGAVTFAPTVAFRAPPLRVVPVALGAHLVLAGAAHAGNDGDFQVTSLSGAAAVFANGAGVAGADAGVTWRVNKYDALGNELDGFHRSYCGRGYRCGARRPAVILILPYGSTAGMVASVVEMLRQRAGAGVAGYVEARANP